MKNEENILKWLNGDLSQDELTELRQTEDFKSLKLIIRQIEKFSAPDFDTEEQLAYLKSKRSKGRVIKLSSKWYRVAAVAASIVLIFSTFLFFNNRLTTVETGIAEQTLITLPDASEVVINAKSQLKYSEKKWNKKREATLKGEAYFKVAKGKTFTVKTEQGNIKVLGTQFNVRERKNLFEVYCYEGKVEVKTSEDTFVLTPGTYVSVTDNSSGKMANFDAEQPGWLQDESTFYNTPLHVVVEELQRQYDVEVVIPDKTLLDKKFTGSFVNNDLDKAIEVIGFLMNLEYEITDKKVVKLYAKN
ncbi:FecR domain-containing protein [Galbibacter sp. EGI 63066]|uniref:FecR family protein n=1 Tax=Galbibacter sp. EGI 63066 TaxID=2993559 RepID=UPI002248EFEE|nr:FecR domain-containing protein [Galbibacter sp. EGI 63066]MCX2680916.1 FecR domain-containing protein [Galbibacter sp. EGI 63066]